jgi:beta-glucanase (GH16 family)
MINFATESRGHRPVRRDGRARTTSVWSSMPFRGEVLGLFLIAGGVACSSGASRPVSVVEPQGYRLVWSDEFSVDGWPDPRNWTYERGFVRNEEHQWYQPDNAVVKDGMLVIEGRRERRPNPNFSADSGDWRRQREFAEYTSTSLTTRGLHGWRYGLFEMRGRIDVRSGMWPAFWTVGVRGPWPAGGEIDIMEFYRGMLLANVAWASETRGRAAWDDVRKPITELGGDEWAKHFHVWRMFWDENEIRLYVDDLLLNTIDLRQTTNRDGSGRNPLREPHYIILNLAIGGQQGGDPSATTFPGKFEVDYVRVYQR